MFLHLKKPPLLLPISAVMTHLDFVSLILSAIAYEEKPENTIQWGAPILLQAKIKAIESAIKGKYMVTYSPCFTPMFNNTLAY